MRFTARMDMAGPRTEGRGSPNPTSSAHADGPAPGFYFVGAHFLYAASSAMIHGVGRDARRVADVIAGRVRAGATAAA